MVEVQWESFRLSTHAHSWMGFDVFDGPVGQVWEGVPLIVDGYIMNLS